MENWSYGDKILYGNFIKAANDDIGQTSRKASGPNAHSYTENNPLVKPFVGDSNMMRFGGFLGQAYLTNRWKDMDPS